MKNINWHADGNDVRDELGRTIAICHKPDAAKQIVELSKQLKNAIGCIEATLDEVTGDTRTAMTNDANRFKEALKVC